MAHPLIEQDAPIDALPSLDRTLNIPISEKKQESLDDLQQKHEELSSPESEHYGEDSEKVQFLKGEPVINSGLDVSKFIVDLRDDGGEALTFRSLVLGTVMAGLGAALVQVETIPTFDSRDTDIRCRSICSSLSNQLSRLSSFCLSFTPWAMHGQSFSRNASG
jgi:hypothetical protein